MEQGLLKVSKLCPADYSAFCALTACSHSTVSIQSISSKLMQAAISVVLRTATIL